MRAALLVTAFGLLAACSVGISDEELEYRGLVAKIKVGETADDVHRAIGSPTHRSDAGEWCRNQGGRREWVYTFVDTKRGRLPLRLGPITVCFGGDNGNVVRAVSELVP